TVSVGSKSTFSGAKSSAGTNRRRPIFQLDDATRFSMERNEQARFIELAKSSSFCSKVYSEIEEIGWEHLVNFSGDLTFLSFRIVDKNQRVHVVGIQLDETYPKSAPSVSADVPYVFNVKWSMNSRLKDLMLQFSNHFEKLEEFWSTLEDIDNSLYVVNAEQSSRSMPFRQIDTGNDCFIMLSIDPRDPKSLPECRFLGSGHNVDHLQKLWQTNSKKWKKESRYADNLASIFETGLPTRQEVGKNDQQQAECGICYTHRLPIDDELGSMSGSATDYMCENANCSRAFHSVCLGDWLRSITTTRQSFDVLFGNCPYCSDPVAIKIIDAGK
ncbi:E3 ubiquitin-protein ligase FANCL, partial [Linum perenne]